MFPPFKGALVFAPLFLLLAFLCGCRGIVAGAPPATTTTTSASTTSSISDIKHVVLMLQENRTFDTYFGMLNPYRQQNNFSVGDDGKTYVVDGIDDKLTKFVNQNDEGTSFGLFKFSTTCIDDETSAWQESYGDVNRFDFTSTRSMLMDGFVHTAENFAKGTAGTGTFSDLQGKRAMGYYDQTFLNYYYYMASQFAISDRWFSPVSSKSIPNRIATLTGGTTQGLVADPANDDHLGALTIPTIFQELDGAGVSWKIYYTDTSDQCLADKTQPCSNPNPDKFPATTFVYFTYAQKYLYRNTGGAACTAPAQASGTAVADPANAFCIDPTHIAPLSQFYTDLKNNTLPSFSYIEAGYGNNDEHPGSGQSILAGQGQVATILSNFMGSPAWSSSVFFLAYDEGGGPFDHVPPVPHHTNDNTTTSANITGDISSIAVNADSFNPCVANGTVHCDLASTDPGANAADAAAQQGFAAQLGFRVPNMVISPFSRKHYVSHIPMDHTAVIKFVEKQFISPAAKLTNRDAAQPDLTDMFDFSRTPWLTPPANVPTPVTASSFGTNPCHSTNLGP